MLQPEAIRRRFLAAGACAAVVCVALVHADEGMWLFNHPPVEKIRSAYGFTPTEPWLDHLQRSSVRFNSGGSGSFVSADGLTFTNHHVAQTCLHAISTAERDLYKTGFYAKTQADEARCPDLELNVLLNMEDVTAKVNEGVTAAMASAAAGGRQRTNMSRLESECQQASSDVRCQVVTLYSGAVYQLYRYKKYTDVRLVFAPEFDVAFFGGDHDNFEFPRYDLDVAFFRIYEHGTPVHLEQYLRWSTGGLKDGDLVFVSGHPGSTDRLDTMSQLDFLRDVSLPFSLDVGRRRDTLLKTWGGKSPENMRQAQEMIFGIENNIKRNTVYLSSLSDQPLLQKTRTEEDGLRRAWSQQHPNENPDANPWQRIVHATEVARQIDLPLQLLERRSAFPGDLSGFARALVRVTTEERKPNGERLREYSDSSLPSVKQALFANTPVYKDMEELLLADGLAMLQRQLPDDPATKSALQGATPAEAAHRLIAGTTLADPAARERLYKGGKAAVDASSDPLIVLMRAIDTEARGLRTREDDEVESVERVAGSQIGRLRFDRSGYSVAPDATFTLRLSYGAVRGYTEDGLGDVAPKGTTIPAFTNVSGAFQRETAMGDKPPFALPETWHAAKQAGKLHLDAPFDFVSTDDIIGGNSGSPVVNRAGELVGIIFDGNMQSLPWRYVFDDVRGRAVSVDSRGILEALRDVYGASRLVDELLGSPSKTSGTAHAGARRALWPRTIRYTE